MRRALAPSSHRIAAIGGNNEQDPWVSVASRAQRLKGRGDSSTGRDWFPRCPYKRPGRGSIPRRSISGLYYK
jgi:hypothetical protein